MDDSRKDEKQPKKNSTSKDKDLNEELKQTFPASDPPSHSRPGHERDSEK
jgi:hypothetical protein